MTRQLPLAVCLLLVASLVVSGCARAGSQTNAAVQIDATQRTAEASSGTAVEEGGSAGEMRNLAKELVGKWAFTLGEHTKYWQFNEDGTAASWNTWTTGKMNSKYHVESRAGAPVLVVEGASTLIYQLAVTHDRLYLKSFTPQDLAEKWEVVYRRQ